MNVVAYYRVSTLKQRDSGLGLDGQQSEVVAFVKSRGAKILGSYTETESGRWDERPQLDRAMAHAKRSKATLLVAKLDRLSRNVAFLSALMETDVDFVACDTPHANKFTIHILAAVAEEEARKTSERTKKALAEYKKKGGLLGASLQQCRKLKPEDRKKGAIASGEISHRNANDAYKDIYLTVSKWRAEGTSLNEIALRLDGLGHTTRRSRPWSAMQVSRVLARAQSFLG